jgi:hypothetical protein
MTAYLCHEEPDLLEHDTEIVAVRPDAVVLTRWALHRAAMDRNRATPSCGTPRASAAS